MRGSGRNKLNLKQGSNATRGTYVEKEVRIKLVEVDLGEINLNPNRLQARKGTEPVGNGI